MCKLPFRVPEQVAGPVAPCLRPTLVRGALASDAFSHHACSARRSYWSPAATTGQRYIYTGSYDGRVHVYGE